MWVTVFCLTYNCVMCATLQRYGYNPSYLSMPSHSGTQIVDTLSPVVSELSKVWGWGG